MNADARLTTHTLLYRMQHPSEGTTEWNAAWNEFIDRFAPLIIYWVKAYGMERDFEDLVQVVLLKLQEKLHSYDRSKASFRTWLSYIARNAVHDAFRVEVIREKHLALYETLAGEKAQASLVDFLARDFYDEILPQILKKVQAMCVGKEWMAFEMTKIDGESAQVAADKLGLSVHSIYKYIQRVQERIDIVRREIETEKGWA